MIRVVYTPPRVNAGAVVHAATHTAEDAAAKHLLAVSLPLVPVDTGDLKGSGEVSRDALGAVVSYDAVAKDDYAYGIRQHEDQTLNHPNGGQAKFLAQPFEQERQAMAEIMASVLRGAL